MTYTTTYPNPPFIKGDGQRPEGLTYKLTLMQKLLGQNYKWWYIFKFYFNKSLAYRLNYFAMIGRYLITFCIFALILYLKGGKESLDYYILASIGYYFYVIFNNTSFEMKDGVLFGKYSYHFLLPTNMHLKFYIQSCGMLVLPFIIRFFIFIGIILALKISIMFSFNLLIALILSVCSTVLIGNFWQTIIGSTSFYLPDNKYILMGTDDLIQLLTGSLVPLVGVLSFLQFTPWSWIIHHPMQIYLGKYDFNQTLMVFAGGIAWCVVLYFLAKWVFKIGLKRNEAVGL